jgi:hypothetical protein
MPCFAFIPDVFNAKSEGQKVNGRRMIEARPMIGLGIAMQNNRPSDTRLASRAANTHPFGHKMKNQP